jgi:hypothetical protein
VLTGDDNGDRGGLGTHAREERRGFYGRLEAVEVVTWAPR